MKSTFLKRFGQEPTYVIRAPGRVNLIGEHIDYSGFSVLPAALSQAVTCVISPNDSENIHLANAEEKFTSAVLPIKRSQFIFKTDDHHWSKYFAAGFLGALEYLDLAEVKRGLNVLVHGTVPQGSGLSSSSALTCAAALACVVISESLERTTRAGLAEACARCERFVGLQGGGMDQAASIFGRAGRAMLIAFNPLKITHVKLPPGVCLVLADSTVEAKKTVEARDSYNLRVVECRLSSFLLAKKLIGEWQTVTTLSDIVERSGLPASELVALAIAELPLITTFQQVADRLGVTSDLLQQAIAPLAVSSQQPLSLRHRTMHVLEESLRVRRFFDVCSNPTGSSLQMLGAILDQGHESMAKLYEATCPELDELCAACRRAGALGARVTGAGFGGWIVALVEEEKRDEFVASVEADFYKHRIERVHMIVSRPGDGASVTQLGH